MTSQDFLMVKTEGRWVLIKRSDIDSICALEHAARIRAGKEEHIVHETVASLEKHLPPAEFVRINRSTIVNIDHVRAIRPKSHGDAIAELITGESHIISRNFRSRLSAQLKVPDAA